VSQDARQSAMNRRGRALALVRLLTERRDMTLLVLIAICVFIITRFTPFFFTFVNLQTLGLAVSFNGIVAIGMTMLMISGGIDISVGASYGLSAIVVGLLISGGFPTVPGILIGLGIGALVGLANAVLVNRFGLSPFLATLGMMSVCRGLLWLVSGGHSIVGLPPQFMVIGQLKFLEIQFPAYIMLALVVVGDQLLRRTAYLRQLYYIGVNRQTAESCGIPVSRVTGFAYILTGLLAAAAGILDGARVGAIYVMSGTGLEFQVITAAVIGGTALSGGRGTIFGSLLGVILMAVLTNVLNLSGVSMYWQNVFVGAILIAVVALDAAITPKEARR
jgi:ribose transport system permease protein